jgi:hypothetical protein
MKCYKHPKADAVGVCSQCGKGVCGKCSVEIGGKLYCKADADAVFGPKTAPKKDSEKPQSENKNAVMAQAGIAWVSCLAGFFILPPVFWGLSLILGYSALNRATNMGLAQKEVLICGIPALLGVGLLVWWGIGIIDLL